MSHPCLFLFVSFLLLLSHLPLSFHFYFFLKSFLQLNTINDLHLHLTRTLCLHLSYSIPLRRTLTVNHYLRIEYFQQQMPAGLRVIKHDLAEFGNILGSRSKNHVD